MIFIFARSGGAHGLGHLSRMINLGYQFVGYNQAVAFITNEESLSIIPDRFFSVHAYGGMPTVQEMLYRSIVMYPESNNHMLIVDDKEVTDHDVQSIPLRLRARISIDNPDANKLEQSYDLLIFPNAHMGQHEIYQCMTRFPMGKVFHGFDYVLMHKDLRKPIDMPTKEKIVTVSSGGSDPDRFSERLVPLFDCLPPGYSLHILDAHHWNFEMIAKSLLHICPWGVTVYEAMCLGTPVLTFPRNIEDYERAKILANRTGGAIDVFSLDFSYKELINVVSHLLSAGNAPHLKMMRLGSFGSVNVHGAARVAALLVKEFCHE